MDFIVAFERKHGRMPSMKTVGAGLGIGNSQHLVDHLRHKGWLSRESKGGPLRIERRPAYSKRDEDAAEVMILDPGQTDWISFAFRREDLGILWRVIDLTGDAIGDIFLAALKFYAMACDAKAEGCRVAVILPDGKIVSTDDIREWAKAKAQAEAGHAG